jgi:hypothetical protein
MYVHAAFRWDISYYRRSKQLKTAISLHRLRRVSMKWSKWLDLVRIDYTERMAPKFQILGTMISYDPFICNYIFAIHFFVITCCIGPGGQHFSQGAALYTHICFIQWNIILVAFVLFLHKQHLGLSCERLRMAGIDDCSILQPGHLVQNRLGGIMTQSVFKPSDRTASHAGVVRPCTTRAKST